MQKSECKMQNQEKKFKVVCVPFFILHFAF